jgi:catechol 2,3-dioxygenase-like lactoylglutathione lyase family enzyme
MIRGINHVAISTRDIDALIEWYQKALGFELVSRGGWPAGNPAIDGIVGLRDSAAKTANMKAGNLFVEIFEYESPAGKPNDPQRPAADHGYTHFCLDVTDIDAEYERLLGCGMTFHAPPTAKTGGVGGLRACYGRDPEGNIIELIEFLDDSHPLYTKP